MVTVQFLCILDTILLYLITNIELLKNFVTFVPETGFTYEFHIFKADLIL